MNRFIVLFFFSLGLVACQPENRVFVEHQELSPNLEWVKKDVPAFEVPIADNSAAYDMSLTFRYANGISAGEPQSMDQTLPLWL